MLGGGGTTVKSSAAKRANAKAAAANKKAATQAMSREESVDPSAAGGSASPTPAPGEEGGDWVVPTRAKPGRKPSQEEPLTKRQAQNRASQRAFRERKQNHVATLEAKVAAYEAEKLTREAKEEENLRKLKQKHSAEVESLKKTIKQLETVNETLRQSGEHAQQQQPQRVPQYYSAATPLASTHAGPSSQTWTPCNDIGCRAPSHEQPAGLGRRKRPLPSRSSSSQDLADRPEVMPTGENVSTDRFGAMSLATASKSLVSSNDGLTFPLRGVPPKSSMFSWPTAPPLSGGLDPSSPSLMARDDIDMDRDCGFCTDSTPCLCRGEALLDLTGISDDDDHGNGSFENSWMDGVDQMIKIEEEDSDDDDDSELALNKIPNDASTDEAGGRPQRSYGLPARPIVSISSLLSSRPKPSPSKPKLWSVNSINGAAAVQSSKTMTASAADAKKKLWWTRPASAQTIATSTSTFFVPAAVPLRRGSLPTTLDEAALCSGDPSSCPACSTDPALAAFCEAVGDDADERCSEAGSFSTVGPDASASRRGSVGQLSINEQPRRLPSSATPGPSDPAMIGQDSGPRSQSTSALPTLRNFGSGMPSTSQQGPSAAAIGIPDAFRQLRSHPSFAAWQGSSGGLNLLADVVSGRGGEKTQAGTSPSMRKAERRARHPSVEIRHDDASTSPQFPPSLATHGRGMSLSDIRTSSDDHGGANHGSNTGPVSAASGQHKRRRLYLENNRVEEALRLLDYGAVAAAAAANVTAASGQGWNGNASSPLRVAARDNEGGAEVRVCGECPCPCPWAQSEGQRES